MAVVALAKTYSAYAALLHDCSSMPRTQHLCIASYRFYMYIHIFIIYLQLPLEFTIESFSLNQLQCDHITPMLACYVGWNDYLHNEMNSVGIGNYIYN